MWKSLDSRIMLSITGIVLVSLICFSIFSSHKAKKEVAAAVEENAIDLMEATRNHVETQHNSILYHKASMLNRRKEELKNNTYIAMAIINCAYEQYLNGELTEEEAKKASINTLEELRYDQEVGYFWINNTERPLPKMVMHPTIPNLNGKVLDNPEFYCALGQNENLFKAAVDICLRQNEGFIDYLWPKPTPQGLSEQKPKLSYVKIFKPWNWIIGTGVYIDDIDRDVQDRIDAVIKDLNKTILKQRIGEEGYFFIFDKDYFMLVHPILANTDASLYLNPETGKPLLQEIRNNVLKDHYYMEYLWDKPGFEGQYTFKKKLYATYYEPLEWFIASSVYIDDLQKKAKDLNRAMLLFSLGFLILAGAASYYVSRSISNPLKRLVASLSNIDKDGLPVIPPSEKSPSEIESLHDSMKQMLSSIRKSRDEIKEQRDFSLHLINWSPQMICVLDPHGITQYTNPAFVPITGYRNEEIIGKNFWEFFFPEKEDDQVKNLLMELTQSEVKGYELQLRHKSGRPIYLVWNSFIKKNTNNQSSEIICFGDNISERKNMEDTIMKSEERFRTFVSNIPGISYQAKLDKDWTMEFISSEAEALTGYPPSDFINNQVRSFASIIYSKDMDAIFKKVNECISKKETFTLEYRIIQANGKKKWVYEKGQGVFDELGKLKYITGVIVDISARKKMDLELKRAKDYLNSIIDFMPSAIIVLDKNRLITMWNHAAERLTGFKSDQVICKSIESVLPHMVHELDQCKDKQVVKKERSTQYEGVTRNETITIYPMHTAISKGVVIKIDEMVKS